MTDTVDSESDIQQQVERNYRWNFVVNVLDGASFWFGISFFSSTIILPLFISHFTENPMVIGLIPFLGWAGYLLPQMFVANAVERAPRKKYFPVTLGFFHERLPIFLLAPAVYFLAGSRPLFAVIAFFVLYTWHNIGGGLISVGWQDMIAKIIPVEKRGRFFGTSNLIGSTTGILGALSVPVILQKFTFPLGYVYSFAITGVFFLVSWLFLCLTREPAVHSHQPPVSQLEYLRSLPQILQKDRNFGLYLLSQIIFSFGGMSTSFLVVYIMQVWNLPDSQASGFMIALQSGSILSNLLFCFLSDRMGHKLSLEVCLALNVLSLVLAAAVSLPAWFYLVFFLTGSVNAGTLISGRSIVYEFPEPEKRPTYIGMAHTIPGVAGALAPLIGGWLAGVAGYRAMFILSTLIGVAAWALLHFAVHEPRKMTSPALP